MDVGAAVIYQGNHGRTDREVYENELRLGDLIEPLGYDSLWGVEHHFSDYMLSPDVLQHLTYFAGRTKRIKLGASAVIMPWHHPMRVAEQVSLLDNMSNGRVVLALGRGIGRREYGGFGVEQSTSRDLFSESAQMLLAGLESGVCEFDGKYIKQARREIRPRPFKSFKERSFGAAVSPESAAIMAKLGLGLLISTQRPWDDVAADVVAYRRLFAENHNREAPPTVWSSQIFCDKDPKRAETIAREYMANYYNITLMHYELIGDHFAGLKGYEHYVEWQKSITESANANEAAREEFLSLLTWGTPDQCYEKIAKISSMINAGTFINFFSYGGLPYDDAESSLRLFAQAVLPQLHTLKP